MNSIVNAATEPMRQFMANGPIDPIPTRYSLLERLKDWDDQTSWRDFYDTYWRLLHNVAIKSGLTETEAQEVVQETVLAVARKIPEFRADPAHGSFSAWLMRLTRWRITDQFRKRRAAARNAVGAAVARSPDDTRTSDPIDRVPDPAGNQLEAIWSGEWESHLLDAALARVKRRVNARHYQMFDLNVLQKLSVPETARTMQVNVTSVYMARSKISRLVKQEIKKLRKEVEP